MPYSNKDLHQEIERIIEGDLEMGNEVRWKWLVHAVLSAHPLVTSIDYEFNQLCRQEAVSEAVRSVLRGRKKDADDPESASGTGTLPGFKYLRRGYPVERGHEIVIVRIEMMTRQERLDRATLYRTMGAGCIAHAAELEKYDSEEAA